MRGSIFVFSILIWWGCQHKPEIITPMRRDITESVYASGTVKSEGQYQVMSMVTGRIAEVMVKPGDSATIGQILFRLESDLADANASVAQLNVENALLSTNYQKIQDARNQIDQLRRKYQLDSVQYQRQANLWSQNIGTKAELDMKELQLGQSKTALESAILQLKDLEKQLKYNQSLATRNLSVSRINQSEYLVRSKINGVIFSVLKEKGDLATPQLPLAIAGDASRYIIELSVDENDIVKVKKDQEVYVKMDSYKDQVFQGRVTSVDPIMDERTRTFTVNAVFTEAPAVLYPNLSLEANIIINQKKDVWTLPRYVIEGDSVIHLADGTRLRVKTGLKDYSIAEITEGIAGTEKVIAPK